ncbi:MAG: response regulator [Cyanobacteria bacterium REEB67]|nr:response regulator [Cyanobacteria bacterium REEB67]
MADIDQALINFCARLDDRTRAKLLAYLAAAPASADRLQPERHQSLLSAAANVAPVMLWTSTSAGALTFLNTASAAFDNVDWRSIEVKGLSGFLEYCDFPRELERDFEKTQEILVKVPDRGGSLRFYQVSARAQRETDQDDKYYWSGALLDVTAQKIAAEKLIETQKQTLEALQIKSNFVANVSHELRTPLNGVLGMLEMVSRGDLSPKMAGYVASMKEAGSSLLTIINDLLDFSKIEAGKIELVRSEFDLSGVVESVADILAPAAGEKNLLLLTSIDSRLPTKVISDPQRLRQILLNLCGNAIKFTSRGEVSIKVEPFIEADGSDQIAFTVIDSGAGISPDFLPQLFEPFVQGQSSDAPFSRGTGLGLSISKRLVELLGGQIFVHSELGNGSVFGFTIPYSCTSKSVISALWRDEPEVLVSDLPSVLVIEPPESPVISRMLQAMGINATVVPTVKAAVAAANNGATNAHRAIFLDTIRFAAESTAFLETIKTIMPTNCLKIIRIIPPLSSRQDELDNWSNLAMLDMVSLPLPVHRRSVLQQLLPLNPRAATSQLSRKLASTTLELQNVPAAQPADRTLTLSLPSEKRRALVADDNDISRHVSTLFLQDLDFDVELANDGAEAVRLFLTRKFDLVLLDCQMPLVNGFEAASIIKEIQQRRQQVVPIFAVTANATEGSREFCLESGMDDYLSKPLDSAVLARLVDQWLGRAPTFRTASPVKPSLSSAVVDESQIVTRQHIKHI